MEVKVFEEKELHGLYRPKNDSSGEENGQVTIIGGSSLFHGAPILSLKAASKIVDMVFFATPEKSVGHTAENIKSKLSSFIWVPWSEVDEYIEKSDAVLIGPGFMRYKTEDDLKGSKAEECDEACEFSKNITIDLLKKFPDKKWVIDAGSLQTITALDLPKGSIITPNFKEFQMLFGGKDTIGKNGDDELIKLVCDASLKFGVTIVLKGPATIVASMDKFFKVTGGNPGLTKGGTGDVQAGLTVALFAKNEALLAASAGAYFTKLAADKLFKSKDVYYNSDDLAEAIPVVMSEKIKEIIL